MKRFAAVFCCAGLLVLNGCEKMNSRIDDLESDYNDLSKRVAVLEEICKEMNTNISSLKSIVNALQEKDFVTGVTPIYSEGVEIGYTIGFTKGAPVTIYHGKDGANGQDGADGQNGSDGKDGVNGQDGHTPVIGVKKDSDDKYYWTIDSEWLLDSDGQKIQASGKDGKDGVDGQDGAPGQDGQPGAPGQNGVTPQMKIEDGMWFVSVDNGQNWTSAGKATGDPGKDGDSFFKSVDSTSNSDYVTFTLANGTTIKLPFYKAMKITLSASSLTVLNDTFTVNYTLSNTVADTYVGVIYGECLEVKRTTATTGTITLKANITSDSYILVMASDTKGNIATAVIQLTKGQISFPEGLEYTVFKEAQSLTVPIRLNYSIRAEVATAATGWLSVAPKTKGTLRDETVVLNVKLNSGTSTRTGVVMIINSETNNVIASITVNQSHYATNSYIDEYGVFQGVGIPITQDVDGTVKTVVWAPVNLGYTSKYKFGKLYQWGRRAGQGYGETVDEDGAAVPLELSPASSTSTTVFTNPSASAFYRYSSKTTYDWYAGVESLQVTSDWNQIPRTSYVGNPCPDGWRVPTSAELRGLTRSCSKWLSNDGRMGFYFKGNNSSLSNDESVFLPAGGFRAGSDGTCYNRQSEGCYRSSTISGIRSSYLNFSLQAVRIDEANRTHGQLVRCVSAVK